MFYFQDIQDFAFLCVVFLKISFELQRIKSKPVDKYKQEQ